MSNNPAKEDLSIQQVSVPTNILPSKPLAPSYLVVLEPMTGKAPEYFVATRFEQAEAFIKVIGFFSKTPEADIINDTAGVLEKAPKTDYVEMWLPWSQIKRVRSLVYRHR